MPNLNETPKIVDFENTLFPGQQANEPGSRHLTGTELAEKLKRDLTINGQRVSSVPAGVLPAGPAGQTRYMEVTAVGTWTYGGVEVGSNAEGYKTTFWWTGSAWVNNGSVKIKGDPAIADGIVAEGDDRAVSGEEVYKKTLVKDIILTGVGINLYDKSRNISGKAIRTATGLIENDPLAKISDFIPASEGDVFVRSGITIPPLNIAFYDASGNPLKPLTLSGVPFATFNVWDSVPFIAPANTVKMAMNVYYNGVDNSDTIMLEKGTVVSPYQPYKATIGEEWLPESILSLKDEVLEISDSVDTLVVDVGQADYKANEALSNSGTAITKAEQSLSQSKDYTDTKVFGAINIQDGAVTTSKLSQAVKDLIATSGGGTINNNADEEDLTSIENQLKLKDGAEGFARIRVRANVADQINEIVTKASEFNFILIKNTLDFGSSPENRVTLTIPNGTVVKFAGAGRLKNVRLAGQFYIEASDKRIFENVEMFNRGGLSLSSDLTRLVIPSTNTSKWWDRVNNTIVDGSIAGEVDYFTTKPLHADIGTPTLDSGTWKVIVGGNTWIKKFDLDEEGYVFLFKSDRYVFVNKDTGEPLPQGTYYNPVNLRVRRVAPINTLSPYCKLLNDFYKLEWWGCQTFNVDNTDHINVALEAISSMQGAVSLSAGGVYNFRGGIIARSNIKIIGNNARFRLKDSATDHLIVRDNSFTLSRFDAENLILEGNKTNQLLTLDGISFDYPFGEDKNTQIYNTTMWGYSWDESCLTKVISENFTGKAFYCAVPGDVSAFNCRGQFSKYGWYWEWEHFKLYECLGWGCEVGLYSSGNHFRIIGGAFAHNTRHNIELDGCQEFQILSPSAIDSDDESVFINNCDRFAIVALRSLNSRKYGLKITNSRNGFVSDSLIFENTIANYYQSGNINVNIRGTVGVEDTQKGGSVPVINTPLNLGSAKTYYNLINAGVTSGTFKFACGATPSGAPAGLTTPFLLDVVVSIRNVYSQRYYVTITSLGDSGEVYFRDFIYNSQTDADESTSTIWR